MPSEVLNISISLFCKEFHIDRSRGSDEDSLAGDAFNFEDQTSCEVEKNASCDSDLEIVKVKTDTIIMGDLDTRCGDTIAPDLNEDDDSASESDNSSNIDASNPFNR